MHEISAGSSKLKAFMQLRADRRKLRRLSPIFCADSKELPALSSMGLDPAFLRSSFSLHEHGSRNGAATFCALGQTLREQSGRENGIQSSFEPVRPELIAHSSWGMEEATKRQQEWGCRLRGLRQMLAEATGRQRPRNRTG